MYLRYYTQQTALNKNHPAINWRHIASTVLKYKAWRFHLGDVSSNIYNTVYWQAFWPEKAGLDKIWCLLLHTLANTWIRWI